jgi:hypothetical protein
VLPQVFELCHLFKRFISYPYILVLSWVRMTRHNHTLCNLRSNLTTRVGLSDVKWRRRIWRLRAAEREAVLLRPWQGFLYSCHNVHSRKSWADNAVDTRVLTLHCLRLLLCDVQGFWRMLSLADALHVPFFTRVTLTFMGGFLDRVCWNYEAIPMHLIRISLNFVVQCSLPYSYIERLEFKTLKR